MKLNDNDRQKKNAEYIDLEALVEQGRQLHSKAVFEMCANMFKRNKISKAKFKIEEQDRRFMETH